VAERQQVDHDRETVHPTPDLDANPLAHVEAEAEDGREPARHDPDSGEGWQVAKCERQRHARLPGSQV
jgi:hypothetical protein